MIYRKRFKGEDDWTEITKEDALNALLGTYKDCDDTRAMLKAEGIIPCMYCDISVKVD